MANKTVSLRLSDEDVKTLNQYGESISEAVRYLVERTRLQTKYADREIAGVFTEDEWKCFADALNGTQVEGDFRFFTGGLCATLEDAELYEHTATKWDVNIKKLIEKCGNLSSSATEAVYRRVEAYWANANSLDFDAWAKY